MVSCIENRHWFYSCVLSLVLVAWLAFAFSCVYAGVYSCVAYVYVWNVAWVRWKSGLTILLLLQLQQAMQCRALFLTVDRSTMGKFRHPLWGCFSDWKVCIFTWYLPCVTAGKVAEKTGRSWHVHCLLFSFIPLASLICRCLVRGDIHNSQNAGDQICDLCVHFWLWPCALCQEAQENGALNQIIHCIERSIERS